MLLTLLIAALLAVLTKVIVDLFAPGYSAVAAVVVFVAVVLTRTGVV